MLKFESLDQLVDALQLHPGLRISRGQLKLPEGMRLFGATGEPAFSGAWVAQGAPWQAPGYRIDHFKMVSLFGAVKSGVIPSTIVTLPLGYRPPADLIFAVASTLVDPQVIGSIKITSAGVVSCETGINTLVSLSGISFLAL